ncbi:superoxide dismutase family protein [Flavobacteriaceae bacterium Ap0902]|nr:superoxide dismutase family protein [Flavobacteriaceae bacterium Ap0902]
MKKNFLMLATLGLITLTSCDKKEENVVVTDETVTVDETVVDETDGVVEEDVKTLDLTFSPASDSNLSGTATLTQNGEEVTLDVNLSGLTPGPHAIHIHEKGDCSAPDASSAGGHWNPTGEEHGKFNVEGFHMGDIGNLEADEDGNATLTFTTDKWCLDCDDESENLVGRSIIIHEGEDDFTTQPTGNAGGRIGCVVIE